MACRAAREGAPEPQLSHNVALSLRQAGRQIGWLVWCGVVSDTQLPARVLPVRCTGSKRRCEALTTKLSHSHTVVLVIRDVTQVGSHLFLLSVCLIVDEYGSLRRSACLCCLRCVAHWFGSLLPRLLAVPAM